MSTQTNSFESPVSKAAAAVTGAAESPISTAESTRRTREILTNVALALFFLQFAIAHGAHAMTAFRLSTFLLMIKISTDVFFYLIRKVPEGVSVSLYDWVIAIAGTYFIMFLTPVSNTADNLLGTAMQFTGMGMQILGMLSLNRSIGIVAANRGVKTSGMYKYVRHPLYLSYLISFLGFVINQFSLLNVLVYSVAVLLWVLRLRAEEDFLMKSEEYRDFAEQTRWRLIPGLY